MGDSRAQTPTFRRGGTTIAIYGKVETHTPVAGASVLRVGAGSVREMLHKMYG
jgi:hypothetical protein